MEILGIRKITDLDHLNLFRVTYLDNLGAEKKWVFSSRKQTVEPAVSATDKPDAVVIVPYHTDEQKLVLIKEFRVATGGYQIGFPAGLIDGNETAEQAGQRELFEETGLEISRVIRQSPGLFSSSGLTDESVVLLYVECGGQPSTAGNEPSEDIQIMRVSPKEAARLIRTSGIPFDVKSWIILDTYARTGKL